MKLYTEEQVNLAMRLMVEDRATFKQTLKLLTPIELPSDEEMERELESYEHTTLELEAGFRAGAKWMQYKILNRNK